MSLADKEFIKTIETGCIKPFLDTFYQVMGHKTHKAERYTVHKAVYIWSCIRVFKPLRCHSKC